MKDDQEVLDDDDYPSLFSSANTYAAACQRQFISALGGNLALLVLSACLSAMNINETWFSLLQVLVLLLTTALTVFLAAQKPQRLWYTARALAESVKTVTWRYMMRAEPFNVSDEEADKVLSVTLFEILEANKHVSSQATQILTRHQASPKMKQVRLLSLPDRKKLYNEARIADQHSWYVRKGLHNTKMSTWWFRALIAANLVAVFFGLLRVGFPSMNNWPTDVAVAIAGSIMAWLQTKRFQELAASYTLAAHEISLIQIGLVHVSSDADFSKFVGDAENAFSREHTQWQARKDTSY